MKRFKDIMKDEWQVFAITTGGWWLAIAYMMLVDPDYATFCYTIGMAGWIFLMVSFYRMALKRWKQVQEYMDPGHNKDDLERYRKRKTAVERKSEYLKLYNDASCKYAIENAKLNPDKLELDDLEKEIIQSRRYVDEANHILETV